MIKLENVNRYFGDLHVLRGVNRDVKEGGCMETLKANIHILTKVSGWIHILKRLAFTLIISVIAVLLGTVLGSLLAFFAHLF